MTDKGDLPIDRNQMIADSTNKWFLDSSEDIREMSRLFGWDYLLVQVKDPESGEKYVAIKTFQITEHPLINEYGIMTLIQALEKVVNKNTFLSKMDQLECMEILTNHMIAVMDDLAMNLEYYGVDSIATLEKVRATIENMSEMAIYRGRGGATMEFIQTVQKTLERIVTGVAEPEKKKRWVF